MQNKLASGPASPNRLTKSAAALHNKEVPIQVMVPEAVRRQVAHMSIDRGESIRSMVLRGLQAIGVEVDESELADRRGRRRGGGGNHGAQ